MWGLQEPRWLPAPAPLPRPLPRHHHPQPPPPGRPSPRGRPAPPPPAYPGPSGLPAPCPGRRGRAPPRAPALPGAPPPGGRVRGAARGPGAAGWGAGGRSTEGRSAARPAERAAPLAPAEGEAGAGVPLGPRARRIHSGAAGAAPQSLTSTFISLPALPRENEARTRRSWRRGPERPRCLWLRCCDSLPSPPLTLPSAGPSVPLLPAFCPSDPYRSSQSVTGRCPACVLPWVPTSRFLLLHP